MLGKVYKSLVVLVTNSSILLATRAFSYSTDLSPLDNNLIVGNPSTPNLDAISSCLSQSTDNTITQSDRDKSPDISILYTQQHFLFTTDQMIKLLLKQLNKYQPKVGSPFLTTYEWIIDVKTCAICLENINLNEDLKNKKCMFLDCAHYYHSQCIIDWLHINQKCPECVRPVSLYKRTIMNELVQTFPSI